jgi:hypothetical protein
MKWFNFLRTFAGKVGNGVRAIVGKMQQTGQVVKDFLFFPDSVMPLSSKTVLEENKNKQVKQVEIRREPVVSMVQKFLNVISLGRYEMMKQSLGYDDVFHLYMLVSVDDGKQILVEKNERINVTDKYQKAENFENKIITDVPSNLTFGTMMSKAEQRMGAHRFYQYNAFDNNCQDFLLGILGANDMLKQDVQDFIKQDAQQLASSLPSKFPIFSQFITDTAGKVSEAVDAVRNFLKRKYTGP